MNNYNSALVIDILRKDHPEIEQMILKRIDQDIPKRLTDLNLVPRIVEQFKTLKGINHASWSIRYGTRTDVNEDRDLLLALILLFYHPEKILMMSSSKVVYGLLISISNSLGCKNEVLRTSLQSVIVAFKVYKEFRDETYRLYELIKEQNQFFE